MAYLRTSLAQFALVDGRRRNHTTAIACREPSRLPFGPARPHLYLLAEHAAADGQEHRFCQRVMQEVQTAFVAEEAAGSAAALAHAVEQVNRALWEGGQELPPHKRLPIGLTALALDGADAYLCQVATGQIFLTRGAAQISLPTLDHWHAVHAGSIDAMPALGQYPDFTPTIAHCRLAPGDLIVLSATNLARLIDAPTLAILARQPAETVVTHLCALAEDYGLLHTYGMMIEIVATPVTADEPFRLERWTPELTVPAVAGRASADRLARVWSTPPAQPARPLPTETLGATTESAHAEDKLPENVVRLYSTPPLAAFDRPVPGPEPATGDAPALEKEQASTFDPMPKPSQPTRGARWLEALSASITRAAGRLRTAPVAATVAAPRSEHRHPATGRRAQQAMPEPVYRAEAGTMAPATAGGFAALAAARLTLRWPSNTTNTVLAMATAGLAAILILTAVANTLRSGGLAAVRGEPADSTAAPSSTAPGMTSTLAPPMVSERSLARAIAIATPATVPTDQLALEPNASEPAALPSLERTTTGLPPSTVPAEAEAHAGRLGPAMVLANLSTTGTPTSTPKQLIAGRGQLYVLDPYTSTLYLIDPTGKPPTPLLSRGWTIGPRKVTDLLGATWRGDTLVVMDRSRTYTLDGPNGTWRSAPLAAASLAPGALPVASFDGNLYILDSAHSKVLKFEQGHYAKPPQPWLLPQEKVDLAGAVDIAIDGRIYALTATGHLLTLFRGSLERRQAIEASPALQTPAALMSPAGSPFLYVAEAGGRILKLTKDGSLVAQWHSADAGADLAGLSDLWVDEANQLLYAVAGNRVLRLPLPDGQSLSPRPYAATPATGLGPASSARPASTDQRSRAPLTTSP